MLKNHVQEVCEVLGLEVIKLNDWGFRVIYKKLVNHKIEMEEGGCFVDILIKNGFFVKQINPKIDNFIEERNLKSNLDLVAYLQNTRNQI
jgi:hypothetical protein